MTGKRTHVVVIGGGYAGTLAANHLRLRGDVDITLVNPRPKFVERIRLHQLVVGNHSATADYGSLLGEGVRLVVDTATLIDAVGSTAATPASIPGAAEYAHPIGELEHAEWLRDTLDQLHPDAPVTVVGAG